MRCGAWTYCELMEEQVHKEGYFVAEENVGAVEGAAGTRQVVGVHSSTERPETERQTRQTMINDM